MYFPYLYAREGELRAVEDLAGRLGNGTRTIPILEPVKSDPRAIRRTLGALSGANEIAYVIANPSKHDLSTSAASTAWRTEMAADLADARVVRPVLEVRASTTLSEISAFVTTYPARPIALSIRVAHIPAVDLLAATARADVLFFLHSSADPAGYSAVLTSTISVEVRDSFRTEVRNADYAGTELFTTAHQHFLTDGRPGFSDYTLLPGRFNASGGPLGAAVIHMSYVGTSGALEVEHFVSDETRQYQSSQPAKLMEAMVKLDAEVRARPAKFRATPGLSMYAAQFAARRPTSPTYNKRQQISHHIDTATSVL